MPGEAAEAQRVAAEVRPERGDFPIVGIGASAGGLEALIEFFQNMPGDNGMAFIIVQHIRPEARSLLREIIQRYTAMKVETAETGMEVEPEHVYVVPPHSNVTLSGRALRLSLKPKHPYIAHSVDFLFRSMAEELKDRAVGIILSGTGSDGAFGAKLINFRLGMVMVQNPMDALYGSMPESVRNLGVADYVLPVHDMPGHLIDYARDYFGRPAREREKDFEQRSRKLETIFKLAKEGAKHDLSQYKLSTVYRRINRRMSVVHVDTIEGYASYLARSPQELNRLVKEFIVAITSFFQDPGAFTALKALLKDLLRSRPEGRELRAWTLGCASGEDSYSFAIMLQECLEELKSGVGFRLFATEMDEAAINIARNAFYPATILEQDITPRRLDKYFVREGTEYRVSDHIRRNVFFSVREFTEPPVFTSLDLITSRSIMVYINRESQKKLIPVFHFALNDRGLLFPGTQDSVQDFTGLFRLLNDKWMIYERK